MTPIVPILPEVRAGSVLCGVTVTRKMTNVEMTYPRCSKEKTRCKDNERRINDMGARGGVGVQSYRER